MQKETGIMLTPKESMELIVKALDGKKGKDIVVLNTEEITILAD
jgi:ribosomal silencing factor RsfS